MGKNKKEGQKPSLNTGHQKATNLKIFSDPNYFWWIGNFGVVPLLRSVTLRLRPEVFFLRARIVSVTFVFDTMVILLKYVANSILGLIYNFHFWKKRHFLCSANQKVNPWRANLIKTSHYFPCIIALFLILLKPARGSTSEPLVVLTPGEHRSIPLEDFTQITVSNRKIMGFKVEQKSQSILIVAKELGQGELLLKSRTSMKIVKIVILSKKQWTRLQELTLSLSKFGLTLQWQGKILFIEGEIKDFSSYLFLQKLISEKEKSSTLEIVFDHLNLNQDLKKDIILMIYDYLYSEWIEDFRCDSKGVRIECFFSKQNPPPQYILKGIQEKYGVQITYSTDSDYRTNFKIRLKFLQITKQDGGQFDLGIENLQSSIGEVFSNQGLSNLIKQNDVVLEKNQLMLKSLAEPEIFCLLGTKVNIRVGEEIPFPVQTNQNGATSIQWKFNGLKINLILEKLGASYVLRYSLRHSNQNSTNNGSNSIPSAGEQSVKIVTLNSPSLLFEIGLAEKGQSQKSVPVLGSIPLIKNLFQEQSMNEQFRKISAIVEIIPIEK